MKITDRNLRTACIGSNSHEAGTGQPATPTVDDCDTSRRSPQRLGGLRQHLP